MEPTTPAVQAIPINKIKPNPNNPRHVIEPQSVEALTASMRAVGQQTPIKVRPLKAAGQKGERENGEKERKDNENAMPQIPLNPPLSNGEDFEYELIGGHLRLEAAKKLG
ncbi:MAG TPA: ParB N-terminal domain-containing protein, partial [bacterium]|nr:ParB N-terminal domain-containing protein [bacterium]